VRFEFGILSKHTRCSSRYSQTERTPAMPERIVLAIDGGVASAAALEWTISRAANTDLHVRLMTIDESRR